MNLLSILITAHNFATGQRGRSSAWDWSYLFCFEDRAAFPQLVWTYVTSHGHNDFVRSMSGSCKNQKISSVQTSNYFTCSNDGPAAHAHPYRRRKQIMDQFIGTSSYILISSMITFRPRSISFLYQIWKQKIISLRRSPQLDQKCSSRTPGVSNRYILFGL